MKKLIFLIIVVNSFQMLKAQIPSSCNVTPVLQTYYDRDVKHLALKRIYDQQSPAADSINVPVNYQDTVWQAMAAIFNLSDFQPRDSVFDIYCIHQFSSSYIFYNIYVNIDTTCTWLQNWQNLITTTGVPALDSLLSKYGFTVTGYLTLFNTASLTTSQTINVRPLCDSIATFSGVGYAEPIPQEGDGDKLTFTKTGTDRFLNFVIGDGDCMSGCTGHRTYKFQVIEDCSVNYLGSYFQPDPAFPFPPPVNCYITTGFANEKEISGFHIFPNPVETILNIGTDHPSVFNFSIINSFGKLMKTGQFRNEATFSIDHYSPGLYVFLLNDLESQERVALKFTKINSP